MSPPDEKEKVQITWCQMHGQVTNGQGPWIRCSQEQVARIILRYQSAGLEAPVTEGKCYLCRDELVGYSFAHLMLI